MSGKPKIGSDSVFRQLNQMASVHLHTIFTSLKSTDMALSFCHDTAGLHFKQQAAEDMTL